MTCEVAGPELGFEAMALSLLLLLFGTEGRPLFYWGARPAAILVQESAGAGHDAVVTEVHAVLDRDDLVLRFTFDRTIRSAMYDAEGRPVSGRVRAILYVDADDDRRTGFDAGALDPRTGTEQRLEVGVVSVGGDATEGRSASGVVSVELVALTQEGRRRRLWQGDDSSAPRLVSAHGHWIEVRLPGSVVTLKPSARLVFVGEGVSKDGRLK